MAAIDICGITKNFGRTEVLKRVDLDIRDGEFLTLVGPSGCGKSTLLRIIAGLESQTGGEIRIAGAAVDHLRARDRDLAMVFQSYALYPHLTVAENIAVPLNMRRLNAARRLPLLGPLLPGTGRITAEIKAEVMATAAMLGIGHLLARRPGQLSGGQRQRVALGRAMVRHPRAFLMDEPLSNLDAKMRVHMRAEIARLHRRLGTTFIYVTHDQAEAMTMSDRLAVMMEGRILQLDTPDAVYDDPADIRVAEFIGSPRINLVTTRLAPSGRLLLGDRLLALRPAAPGITPGAEIRLGFRPEHADLVPADRAALCGRVSLLENLGSDLLVHLELDDAAGGGTAVVRLDPARGRPAEGEICGIAMGPKPLAFGADGARLPLAAAPAAEMAHV